MSDKHFIFKGSLLNMGGMALRVALSPLMLIVPRFFPQEIFGIFISLQSFIAVCRQLFGLELGRGLAWWIPRRQVGVQSARRIAMERVVAPHEPHIPIDMVYTYVDGSDPAHLEKRLHFEKSSAVSCTAPRCAFDSNSELRYRNVGEITYSVRSVLKYLPWVRKIFIITDSQRPPVDKELIESGRVLTIDHREIMLEKYLPTFNSIAIESFMHRIDGLSEIFLYNNDDCMHFSQVDSDFFISPNGTGKAPLNLHVYLALFRRALHFASRMSRPFAPYANLHTVAISNAHAMLRKCRHSLSCSEIIVPWHVTQVMRRSTAMRLEEEFEDELEVCRRQKFRNAERLSYGTIIYSMEKKWNPEDQLHGFASRSAAGYKMYDFSAFLASEDRLWEKIEKSRARFACLNNIPVSGKARFLDAMKLKGL